MHAAFSFAQFSIYGTVTDAEGQSLVGANVILEETNHGTTTDYDGRFVIGQIPEGTYKLKISFIGYISIVEEIELDSDIQKEFRLLPNVIYGKEIIVKTTRAGEKTPTTYSIVRKAEIEKKNMGQDMPYLLSLEPSVVTTSDAGAGVGYTGLWIRGSNIQRINVTINGIPVNDPESHGVFWVNMPDFASSVQSAQIQRGVGTSTNGGGAFGATINLETNLMNDKAFGEISSSFGSFNTWKSNVRFGSGLIKDHWVFEGRTSIIKSDGYVDRANSDLRSLFLQGGYFTDNTKIKAVYFTGKEKTYQAWWGVDQWTIDNLGRTYNWAGVIYNDDGTERYYDNQTDNYQQDHYQLHLIQQIMPNLKFNGSLHYTYGRGYYEEYYQQEPLSDYPVGVQYFGLDSILSGDEYEYFYYDSVTHADMIVRRWLDNHFYGGTFGLNYSLENLELILGGSWNKYGNAKHFGEIIWSQFTGSTNIRDKYYDNVSNKTDFTSYLKINYKIIPNLNIFADLQYRGVNYTGEGIDKSGESININENYNFYNPKFGASIETPGIGMIYASYAIANREPIRTDFLDAPEGVKPEPERLGNLEAGIRKVNGMFVYNANVFWMCYGNQLVLTGEINDVGAPIRENVGNSYRLGIELDGKIRPSSFISVRANLALSENKTDYKEQVEDDIIEYNNTTISFSPSIVGGGEIELLPLKSLSLALSGKYVGRQYLDNTENNYLSLDPYFMNNLKICYTTQPKILDEISFSFLINNIFDIQYMSNGYVWESTPYFYPQAGINFFGGIDIRF